MDLALLSKQRGASQLLEVSLLGEQYVAGSTATNLARSSRSIALLGFLAVHADAPQPRQRLAAHLLARFDRAAGADEPATGAASSPRAAR